jgi:DNA-binding HxlR family transcriptional regulator
MRSYEQYCALAKALDVIGDRWTLLIVRELLIRGRCRYTDLRNGLPGIATNLLADRLREMEAAGIVRREDAPPPIATTLFQLTTRGEELEPVLHQLGRWGGPLLAKRSKRDAFRTHWLSLPAKLHLTDRTPDRLPITIELRTGGDEPLLIETIDGAVRTRPGRAANPDAVLTGTPQVIVGVLTGKLDLAAARAAGLRYDGDPKILRRVQPHR